MNPRDFEQDEVLAQGNAPDGFDELERLIAEEIEVQLAEINAPSKKRESKQETETPEKKPRVKRFLGPAHTGVINKCVLFQSSEIPEATTILQSITSKIARQSPVSGYKRIELEWLNGEKVEYRSTKSSIAPEEVIAIFDCMITYKSYLLLEKLINRHTTIMSRFQILNHEDLYSVFIYMLSKQTYANAKVYIWYNCPTFVTWLRSNSERIMNVIKNSLVHFTPPMIAIDIWKISPALKRIFIINHYDDILMDLIKIPEPIVRELFQFKDLVIAIRSRTDDVLARLAITYLNTHVLNVETNQVKLKLFLNAIDRPGAIEDMLARTIKLTNKTALEFFVRELAQRLQDLNQHHHPALPRP